ncbi:MAG: hypothetical protein H3C47_00770 [Candidatus Cloacimonetes bacterium]|nr:hypothetical protein [Candidatus Cloacimonadota bacterium]
MKLPKLSLLVLKECIAKNVLGIHLFYIIVLFLLISFAQGAPDVFARRDLFLDGGMTVLFLFSLFFAMTVTFPMILLDLKENRLMIFLSTYVSRSRYVLHKALGAGITIALNHIILCILTSLSLYIVYETHPQWMFTVYWAIFLESLVLASAALFLSVTLSRFMAMMSTGFLFLIGHFTYYIEYYVNQLGNPLAGKIILNLYSLLPNFEVFGLKNAFLTAKTVPDFYILWLSVYASGWILVFLLGTCLWMEKKEF